METVFIADDEVIIRDGLKCIIDWNALGFQICGEAGNGEDALKGILSLQPSLVLLDIRMPKLQGIEVITAAREQGFKGRVIILSGYSDFKYAQAAIKFGVDFYLTKPIDEDELLQAIENVKGSIEKDKKNSTNIAQYKEKARHVILHDLLHGEAETSSVVAKDILLDAPVYQVVIYENYNPAVNNLVYNFADLLKVANQRKHFFEHLVENHKDVILLKGEFALDKFQSFLSHYEHTPPQKDSPLDTLFLVYGKPVTSLGEISHSYLEATTLLTRRFFCIQGQHTLGYQDLPAVEAMTKEISTSMVHEYSSTISEYLKTFNRKKVVESLSYLEHFLYNCRSDINTVKLFLSDLYLQIKENMNHIYSTVNIPFPTNSSVLDLIEKKYFLYEIIQFLSEQFEMIMNATGSPSRDSVLDDILFYIDHNYKDNIKLETIAPLFGYNSAYLGKIFSKTVGESFNSYVDNKRIDYSKELLIQNKLKVYEIAELVGYKNVDYFHKKFKKYVGESPAEFRKNMDLI